MVESKTLLQMNDRQIEDIIDLRKKKGQYDVCIQSCNLAPCRFAYTAPSPAIIDDKVVRFDEQVWMSDGEIANCVDPESCMIGPTDSEITVVRVKREGMHFKLSQNNWNLHDDAVPGDGTYLGESPSLVNLVTLVGQSVQSFQQQSYSSYQTHEYLVPLSSWDPTDKPHDFLDICTSAKNISERPNAVNNIQATEVNASQTNTDVEVIKAPDDVSNFRRSLVTRISRFLRKQCSKTKTERERM